MKKTSPVREQELKLNAGSAAAIAEIKKFILSHPAHYSTPNTTPPDWLQGMFFNTPQRIKPLCGYVYYDDARLSGFRNGVDIRMEAPLDLAETVPCRLPCKQMVKIAFADAQDGVMDRMEYSALLQHPYPSLAAVDRSDRRVEERLKAVFQTSSLGSVKLYPYIQIGKERWETEYHPDGDKNAKVEIATDAFRARTFTGFQYEQFQVEIEIKEGSADALCREKNYLSGVFNLQPDLRGKAALGFDELSRFLVKADKLQRREVREAVVKTLVPGRFQIFQQLPACLRG